MTVNGNASMVRVRVGDEEFNYRTEPACNLCRSQYRLECEQMTAQGRTWSAILKALPPDADLTVRNLADHFRNGHLPVQAAAVQQEARAHAETVAEPLRTLSGAVAKHLALAHAVVGRVAERLAAGEVEPMIKDGLTAARFIEEMEQAAGFTDTERWTGAMVVLIDEVRELLDESQFQVLGSRLARHPILQRLA